MEISANSGLARPRILLFRIQGSLIADKGVTSFGSPPAKSTVEPGGGKRMNNVNNEIMTDLGTYEVLLCCPYNFSATIPRLVVTGN